jgi:bifunctional UDP-N-acetylglucosamine pyrophosphorylase/glucosamine-1-phosphate N-acetyltransferase
MKQGVSLIAPETVFINYGTKIGADTLIYPFTVIERDVKIGKNCSVGPFAHLREGTRLADNVCAGNFIEMVRTSVGENVFVKHFSYLGDTRVGRGANIGAGTVTANFDGSNKHYTVIGENAFIGSDTVMIAPVRIGKGAKTGAGSVVTKGCIVPDGGVVVGVPARALNRGKR